MLPRSGTRAAVWQANLSLAAKFRGPLLSGPLGSPCFRARYRDGENKECRPAARHRRPYFANNFCDRVLPLPLPSQRRDFVFWKEWSCWQFLADNEVSCLSSREEMFLNVYSYVYERNISRLSLSLCHFEFFPAWICGLVRSKWKGEYYFKIVDICWYISFSIAIVTVPFDAFFQSLWEDLRSRQFFILFSLGILDISQLSHQYICI